MKVTFALRTTKPETGLFAMNSFGGGYSIILYRRTLKPKKQNLGFAVVLFHI